MIVTIQTSRRMEQRRTLEKDYSSFPFRFGFFFHNSCTSDRLCDIFHRIDAPPPRATDPSQDRSMRPQRRCRSEISLGTRKQPEKWQS